MGSGELPVKGGLEVRRGLMRWEMRTEGTLHCQELQKAVTGEVWGKESILC